MSRPEEYERKELTIVACAVLTAMVLLVGVAFVTASFFFGL
jgi:hypothetical protein